MPGRYGKPAPRTGTEKGKEVQHLLLAVAAAHKGAGWQHELAVVGNIALKFIKFIAIAIIIALLIFRGGMNPLQGLVTLILGMLIVVGFSPKVGAFIEKVNSGNTVSSTGATIGELVVLVVLILLAFFAGGRGGGE